MNELHCERPARKKKETSEYLTKINDSDISFLPY